MPVFGSDPEDFPDHWPRCCSFKALGHLLSPDASIVPCWENVKRLAWAAFWRNVSTRDTKKFAANLRLAQIKRIVQPVVVYRVTRYPFTASLATSLDCLQKKMIAIAMGIRKDDIEDASCFIRRRGRLAAVQQRKMGMWSRLYANLVVNWASHVERDTSKRTWAKRIVHIRSNAELAWRRADMGRPFTRLQPGFTCRRWWEGVDTASLYLNSD